jgi:hypothetical protein
MNWLRKKIIDAYDNKIDASGLAFFRIVYSIVLLGEVGQLYFFRHLIFDKVAYVEPSEIDFSLPLILWMISLVMLSAGISTRLAAIVNYLFSLVFISTIHAYEYHMFFIYMGVNFLLMFIDSGSHYSVDRVWKKLKYSTTSKDYVPSTKTPALNYYMLILVGIGFMYFDSVFYKMPTHMWSSGLGVWLPSSLPPVVFLDHTFLLNQKLLMIFLGYLTLAFETIFIFIFWFKKMRLPILILGIGLHTGIMFVYPIPWFAAGFIALYLLMVPVGCWKRLAGLLTSKKSKLTVYYNDRSLSLTRLRIVMQSADLFHFISFQSVQSLIETDLSFGAQSGNDPMFFSIDSKGRRKENFAAFVSILAFIPPLFIVSMILRIPGISNIAQKIFTRLTSSDTSQSVEQHSQISVVDYLDNKPLIGSCTVRDLRIGVLHYAIAILVCLQLISIYNSTLMRITARKIGFEKTAPGKIVRSVATRIQKGTKIVLGITGHTVFLDHHFEGYNHVIAIRFEGDKSILPIIDLAGMPDYYLSGPTWAKWSFRVNGAAIDMKKLEGGVRDFTAFWLVKQGMSFENKKFSVLVKKIDPVRKWERDFLSIQRAKPWVVAGTVTWNDDVFSAEIQNIENL